VHGFFCLLKKGARFQQQNNGEALLGCARRERSAQATPEETRPRLKAHSGICAAETFRFCGRPDATPGGGGDHGKPACMYININQTPN
jgi:hypothetical protein